MIVLLLINNKNYKINEINEVLKELVGKINKKEHNL